MLQLIWLILSIILIYLIFSRVPKNEGLASFSNKTNIFGSPNSTERFLNNFTIVLIVFYLLIAVKLNLIEK